MQVMEGGDDGHYLRSGKETYFVRMNPLEDVGLAAKLQRRADDYASTEVAVEGTLQFVNISSMPFAAKCSACANMYQFRLDAGQMVCAGEGCNTPLPKMPTASLEAEIEVSIGRCHGNFTLQCCLRIWCRPSPCCSVIFTFASPLVCDLWYQVQVGRTCAECMYESPRTIIMKLSDFACFTLRLSQYSLWPWCMRLMCFVSLYMETQGKANVLTNLRVAILAQDSDTKVMLVRWMMAQPAGTAS